MDDIERGYSEAKTVPIFSCIDLVYDMCIIEIIVRHLAQLE